MAVTDQLLVDAESCNNQKMIKVLFLNECKLTSGVAVKEVWMFTGQTVWTIIGGLAGLDTTMWVSDLVFVLFSKPIIQIVTVFPCPSIIVTGAPE